MPDPVEGLRTGRCLCGAPTMCISAPIEGVEACHCSACRRVTGGGPYLGVTIPKDALDIDGAENVAVYRSSEHAERGFCRLCGANLFFRMAGDGRSSAISLCVGVLDDSSDLALASEMFWDQKPELYNLVGARTRMTGAEAEAALVDFLAQKRQQLSP